jgi:hypothetical protein
MKALVIFSWAALMNLNAVGQELFCTVDIDFRRVRTQETQVFSEMKNAIETFLNSRQWTKDKFENNEKIRCGLSIILDGDSDFSRGFYKAKVTVNAVRPVYMTDYETTLMTYVDPSWAFEYRPSEPMIFSENTYTTELTSLLAYYAYFIIALDYDTFSPNGGDIYYQTALNILNNSLQGRGSPGWNSQGDLRDRHWLIQNMTVAGFSEYRDALYLYHRKGLDIMSSKPDVARKNIFEALKKLDRVRQNLPGSLMLRVFFDSKNKELQNIFSKGDLKIRTDVVELLTVLDPINSGEYRKSLK